MNRLNLLNQTFGRLKVTDFAYSKNGRSFNNRTLSVAQWAKELGIKNTTIHERLRKGWSVEKTLSKINYKKGVSVMG